MQLQRPTAAPVPWADDLFTFGVTGTNGKTSTVHMLAAIVRAAEQPVLDISTLGYRLNGETIVQPNTARGFMDACKKLHDAGGRFAAIECTSESLARGYAKRWRFDLGVFTNLSADHLSTHGSWENYLGAKAQLFTHLGPGRSAVLNAADECSLLLDRVIPADVQRRFYGSPTRGPLLREPDLAAASLELQPSGTAITLRPSPWADRLGGTLQIQMVGAVFAENALAAATAALAADLDPSAIVQGLADCPPVRGRFEVLAHEPVVVVDYAHTPDALARTCDAARSLSGGRLIVVFGAGGNRDRDKRGPMGEAVASRADLAIITNDNPRDEDPEAIAQAVRAGATGHRATVELRLDRGEAIAHALSMAAPEDIVVIAGKGHETGQEVAGTVRPWSDHEAVMGGLQRRRVPLATRRPQ